MRKRINVLITACGAPGIKGTIFAIKNNPDLVDTHVVGVDVDEKAVGQYLVERFYRVPAPEDPKYINVLLDICCKEKVDVVIPQATRELSAVSKNIDFFKENGIAVMVSPYESIMLANDKLKILELFANLGLPYPNYQLVSSIDELRNAVIAFGYPERPVVVKPPVSNGMRGLRILRDGAWDVYRFLSEKPSGVEVTLEELITILEKGDFFPQLIVSEYLPGKEYSVDAFVGKHIKFAIPRVRNKIVNGISFSNEIELREDMIRYTLEASQEIGLRYCFGFQYKLDEHGLPKVLECNPRVQGTMVASVFTGANVIWCGVREALGEPLNEPPNIKSSVEFHRTWGGIGVVDGKAEEI